MNKTYEDSVLIPIPSFKNDTIFGRQIPVNKGYYKYNGYLYLANQKLKVHLFYLNTDDNTQDANIWNGEYYLIKP